MTLSERLLALLGLIPMVLVGVAAAAFLLYIVGSLFRGPLIYAHSAWFKHRMKRVPLVPFHAFEAGVEGRVTGQIARIAKPLIAPLSGRECAYYQVVVEVWVGDRFSTYRKLLDEERGEDFVLHNATGEILVRMSEAQVLAEQDAYYASGPFNKANSHLEAYLARHGHKSTDFLGFNKSMRYRESILGYDEQIAAVGIARRQGDELVLGASDDVPLRVSDLPSVV